MIKAAPVLTLLSMIGTGFSQVANIFYYLFQFGQWMTILGLFAAVLIIVGVVRWLKQRG